MIRDIQEGDLKELLRLYEQLHGSKVAIDSDALSKRWNQILQDENHHIIVAEADGRIISSCVCVIIPNLTHNQQPYALIENVITDEAYRRKGFATRCLDYAKDIAQKEKCYKLMLLTGSKDVFVNLKVEQKGFQKVSTCQHRQFRGSPCRAAG